MKSKKSAKKLLFIATNWALIYLFMASSVLYAQNNIGQDDSEDINTITTAVPFLLIAPDTRSGGMGDVGVATTADVNAIHWNPAKLAYVPQDIGISVSYTPWLRALVPDINLAYLSAYKRVDKNQTFGMSILYFSLGEITFTDQVGNVTGQFKPNEFAADFAYARKLSDYVSFGLAARYIYSNLTNGIYVSGTESKPGQSVAVDVSTYYENDKIEISDMPSILSFGLNISNIGAKISYTATSEKDFIPINLRLGTGLTMELDDYNTLGIYFDVNKLLVPTPPVYATDSDGNTLLDPITGDYVIDEGKDPNVAVPLGMVQSFYDAPGGWKEELREITYSVGGEYWYDKQFCVRTGLFYEHSTKGNRKYMTMGAGLKYNVFGLDFAYLIPFQQKNPLENTLRFTLSFDFEAFKEQNKN